MTTQPRARINERREQALELMLQRGSRQLRPEERDTSADQIANGVTAEWLSQVLGIERLTVKRKLKHCPALYRKAIGNFYDFKVAVQYLVKPKFNIDEYLQNLRVDELPIRLQSEYWAAKKKRTEWETDAGALFHAADVQRDYGEIFLMIRSDMQLWIGVMEDKAEMTPQQSALLERAIDSLQERVYEKVRERVGPELLSLLEEERRIEEKERSDGHEPGYVEDIEGEEDDDTPFV